MANRLSEGDKAMIFRVIKFKERPIVSKHLSFLVPVVLVLMAFTAHAAWMGVDLQDHSIDQEMGKGIKIVSVFPKGPGDRAGLQAGDVLLSANDFPLHDSGAFVEMINDATAGQTLYLKVWRQGRIVRLNLLLDEKPKHFVHLEEGLSLVKKGEYEKAIISFTKAIELNPDFGLAYYWRGQIAAKEKKAYDQAIADCTIRWSITARTIQPTGPASASANPIKNMATANAIIIVE